MGWCLVLSVSLWCLAKTGTGWEFTILPTKHTSFYKAKHMTIGKRQTLECAYPDQQPVSVRLLRRIRDPLTFICPDCKGVVAQMQMLSYQ